MIVGGGWKDGVIRLTGTYLCCSLSYPGRYVPTGSLWEGMYQIMVLLVGVGRQERWIGWMREDL